ncbi:carbohydrate ABC transporter substrate-binding protein (CUT1 family) [Haloactinopolyspora alba]|uniref:Carbohydrate ABC transporter substrate-binding protein (CUT1 family) n=1 Tax=Haloactinopolyspora alba TaxID=648780 RepID=A0A2P8DTA1_9ACTN|nr:ABC transporter substrate-binding protein [Haloactinopolyspora alba]PSL00442.1 carbohydrate ABC transporter substrate-binding protein (CUT1 family) [Haloactinopolyspora alba]
MNRRKSAVTAAAIAAVMLSACASGSETSGGASDTLTLNGDRADFVEAYKAAGEELEELTGYGIDPRNVPSTESYQQVIRSSLQSDSATDLVKWWSGYRLKELARTGGLANLDAEWEAAVENDWVNPDTAPSFSYDGHVYAMPMYKSYWVIFYNKKIYEDLGLSVPTTWEQFIGNAQTIKDAGITPFFGTQEAGWTAFIWFGEILSKLNPEFYADLMNGDAKYTDEPARRAMEIWSDLYERGFFTSPDVAWDDEPALFQSGEVAMVPMGTWRNAIFTDNGMTEQDYGAFVMPTIKPDVTPSVIVESGVFAVPEKAPNKEAAVETLGEWLNPDVQEVWVDEINDISANPQVEIENPILTSVTEQVQQSEPIELERYWEASPPSLVAGNVKDLATFMVDPSKENIGPTLQRMQERAEQEWAKWEQE